MRIYEFAKKYNISNKEILSFLQQEGFNVQSHMALIPPPALALLTKKYADEPKVSSGTSSSAPVKPQKVEEKKKAQEEPVKTPVAPVPVSSKLPTKETPAQRERETSIATPVPDGIPLEPMSVSDFALRAKKPVGDVILTLLRQGTVAVKNQAINEKVVAQLARYYGLKILEEAQKVSAAAPKKDIEGEHTEERLPVVVVIGHVDHGKTTLLDFIRKTRVAAKEKGGITQHLGAYEAKTKQGDLVFLDTPGHAAFTKMRERGTRVADIAVLVVAADDGAMPQTVEAIKQAQAANIPLVVAINKIDKASPTQIEAVKRSLTQYGLVPEDWGGQTIFMPISAKFGTGVDELLDVLVLQSKVMELTAALDIPARGYVLEAKQEKGRGSVATVLSQHGILKVGDTFVTSAGLTGKVTSLIDSSGKRIRQAYPSQPVQVAGFESLPQAGDTFEVISSDEMRKIKQTGQTRTTHFTRVSQDHGINVILKVDNDSSREALIGAIEKLNDKAFQKINIIAAGIGAISESDIQLADDTGSAVYGFHTKADPAALALATKTGVAIHQFDIIYRLLEYLENITNAGRPVKKVAKKTGEAIILKVFDIKNIGKVAGGQVKAGKIIKDGKITVWRGKHKVGEGVIKSLQREKKTIKEALTGMEFAFMVEGFDDWLPEDRVECYQEVAEA